MALVTITLTVLICAEDEVYKYPFNTSSRVYNNTDFVYYYDLVWHDYLLFMSYFSFVYNHAYRQTLCTGTHYQGMIPLFPTFIQSLPIYLRFTLNSKHHDLS